MKRIHTSILLAATLVALVTPSAPAFDGLDTGIGNLYRLSNAKSRSISPENLTGEKGRGGMATTGTGKPIRFEEDLKVTIQALGWSKNAAGQSAYLQLEDDISSVAYWYQTEPHAPFPKQPGLPWFHATFARCDRGGRRRAAIVRRLRRTCDAFGQHARRTERERFRPWGGGRGNTKNESPLFWQFKHGIWQFYHGMISRTMAKCLFQHYHGIVALGSLSIHQTVKPNRQLTS